MLHNILYTYTYTLYISNSCISQFLKFVMQNLSEFQTFVQFAVRKIIYRMNTKHNGCTVVVPLIKKKIKGFIEIFKIVCSSQRITKNY